jgi:signal transduction histidine kinase
VEIYRIAQESLNNVVKYARASQVEIKVRLDTNRVHMEIKDNGVGFDPACVKPTSLGLRIMRERAESIHAELQVTSLPGQGTTVNLDWHK